MKRFNKKIYGFALVTMFLGGVLTSCENSLEDPNIISNEGIQVIKTPDVVAYSGQQILGNTFGTRTMNVPMMYSNAGDGDINNQKWKEFDTSSLENITDEERYAVLAAIAKRVTGNKISEDLVFPWTDYFLQDVITMENGNYTNAGSNGMKDVSVNYLEAFNKGAKCDQQNYPGYDFEDYETVTNSKKLNTYFQKQTATGQERINQTALMNEMTVGTYEEMRGHQFRVWVNCHISDHYYDYIIVNVDGNYYICFDFGCGTEEHDKDGDPGKGATFNDWDYNDWILKITPAGNQPDVWTESPNEDPGTPEQPETPDVVKTPDHVEVNLSINDSHEGYVSEDLWSKLSIHVRYGTDVSIKIPLETKYVCESDDLVILENHYKDIWNTDKHYVEYNINGTKVTLTTSFEFDQNDVTKGWIEVTTEGITDDVIEYLMNENGDGINFEIYLYWQSEMIDENGDVVPITDVSRAELQELLNQSTIEFTNTPPLYVNAFNDKKNGEIFEGDCTVDIVNSQKTEYNNPEEGYHYNGSDKNQLYEKK